MAVTPHTLSKITNRDDRLRHAAAAGPSDGKRDETCAGGGVGEGGGSPRVNRVAGRDAAGLVEGNGRSKNVI